MGTERVLSLVCYRRLVIVPDIFAAALDSEATRELRRRIAHALPSLDPRDGRGRKKRGVTPGGRRENRFSKEFRVVAGRSESLFMFSAIELQISRVYVSLHRYGLFMSSKRSIRVTSGVAVSRRRDLRYLI